ncbi:response regulator [Roseateles sp.]|uniref:response regulator n=1 Tax=Roseateles sp. TaxID=1971397 RepID=UPI0031D24A06
MSHDTPDTRPTILVIDDAPEVLSQIYELLKERYRIKVSTTADSALRIAAEHPQPDLILLDVLMPSMDGYELCRWLKADEATRDIPVLFLTARSDVADESHGLSLGAVDYITKPISPPILLARVRTHLQLKAAADLLRERTALLEAEIARRDGGRERSS